MIQGHKELPISTLKSNFNEDTQSLPTKGHLRESHCESVVSHSSPTPTQPRGHRLKVFRAFIKAKSVRERNLGTPLTRSQSNKLFAAVRKQCTRRGPSTPQKMQKRVDNIERSTGHCLKRLENIVDHQPLIDTLYNQLTAIRGLLQSLTSESTSLRVGCSHFKYQSKIVATYNGNVDSFDIDDELIFKTDNPVSGLTAAAIRTSVLNQACCDNCLFDREAAWLEWTSVNPPMIDLSSKEKLIVKDGHTSKVLKRYPALKLSSFWRRVLDEAPWLR